MATKSPKSRQIRHTQARGYTFGGMVKERGRSFRVRTLALIDAGSKLVMRSSVSFVAFKTRRPYKQQWIVTGLDGCFTVHSQCFECTLSIHVVSDRWWKFSCQMDYVLPCHPLWYEKKDRMLPCHIPWYEAVLCRTSLCHTTSCCSAWAMQSIVRGTVFLYVYHYAEHNSAELTAMGYRCPVWLFPQEDAHGLRWQQMSLGPWTVRSPDVLKKYEA